MNIDALKQHYYPICELSAVSSAKPLQCLLWGTPIVIFKTKTEVVAFIDKCPHRGVPLSSGKLKQSEIQCPYHGWQFNHQGQCTHIPGLCSELKTTGKELIKVKIKIHCNLIFACLNPTEETQTLFQASHFNQKNYHTFIWPSLMHGDAINILENFLDGCHTHFVHQGLLRTQKNRKKIKVELSVSENKATVIYHDGKIQTGIISKLFEPRRTHSVATFHYPLIAQIEYYNQDRLHFAITVFLCPLSDNKFKAFSLLTHPKTLVPNTLKKWLFMPFIKLALKQDKHILTLQRQNLAHFENANFASTELDILRSHLIRILNQTSKNYHKALEIEL